VKKNILRTQLIQIFIKHQLSKKHSEICADYLIKAELVNAPSHGLARLKMYCDRIKKKLINPKPKIQIKRISSSVSYVDGDDSIGFVAADIGINQAITNAKKTGIGLVAVKKSGHYGLSSFYAEQAVKKNLIVFCFTNAPPALAPHGAKKSLFGTNPICFGVPTGKTPFILDASTSMINRGKIRRADKLDEKIPFGVALDRKGKITTNAREALLGTQLPIAGFKGSGLAWMVDILSGVLTGSSHGGKTKDPFDDFTGPQNMGHLFITINPKIFSGNNFIKEMKKNIKLVKRLPKAKGFNSILYPGERKNKTYKKNLNRDISIPSKILSEMDELNAI
jgi:L-2-hydroxycarboxylate dehydrogenase (NAD+)|tara:strand:+ start:340 stop:1347 length:1008 start_codon:yes stop_codon:yes gene_type:complete